VQPNEALELFESRIDGAPELQAPGQGVGERPVTPHSAVYRKLRHPSPVPRSPDQGRTAGTLMSRTLSLQADKSAFNLAEMPCNTTQQEGRSEEARWP